MLVNNGVASQLKQMFLKIAFYLELKVLTNNINHNDMFLTIENKDIWQNIIL